MMDIHVTGIGKDRQTLFYMFQHGDSHRFIWSSRKQRQIIDYIMCHQKLSDIVLEASM